MSGEHRKVEFRLRSSVTKKYKPLHHDTKEAQHRMFSISKAELI